MAAPIGNVTNVSKSRISDEATMNQAVITVTFDQDIVEFRAKLNGADYNTGTTVDTQSAMTVAQMAALTVAQVATKTVGEISQVAVAGANVLATIDWNEGLSEGSNRINLYGKNKSGEWSAYPV